MENYTPDNEEIDLEPVEIYSKNAIRGFSIFFSTIFGGVLLYQNLKTAGYKKGANTVLTFAIIYTLITVIIVSNLAHVSSSSSIVFNLIGGFILSDYFFSKYFPDNDYYPKPIWNALGVSILICIVLVTIIIYSGGVPNPTAIK